MQNVLNCFCLLLHADAVNGVYIDRCILKMPAAITAAPSNIAVSSSVGEASLEVRRSKFDVLEAILRAS